MTRRDPRARDLEATPDWGENDPVIERHLEFIYSRIYHSYYASPRVGNLSEEEIKRLAMARLNAHRILDVDDHSDIRLIEREIRKIERGAGPDEVSDTTELDVAWAHILLPHLDEITGIAAVDLAWADDDTDDGGDDSR